MIRKDIRADTLTANSSISIPSYQTLPLSAPRSGSLAYQTTTGEVYVWVDSQWVTVYRPVIGAQAGKTNADPNQIIPAFTFVYVDLQRIFYDTGVPPYVDLANNRIYVGDVTDGGRLFLITVLCNGTTAGPSEGEGSLQYIDPFGVSSVIGRVSYTNNATTRILGFSITTTLMLPPGPLPNRAYIKVAFVDSDLPVTLSYAAISVVRL
jgi:hypothetical protein